MAARSTAAAKISALVSAIDRRLQLLADPGYAAQAARLIPGIRTIGVRVPKIRALAAEIAAEQKDLSFAETCDLLDALAATRVRDAILTGVFLVARRKKDLRAVPWPRVLAWARAADNWEACDQIATGIAAPRVAAEIALVADLCGLAHHDDRWQRRFAVATTTGLNQQGRSFPAEALRVCAEVVGDADPMVQKALGWALREASEKDAAAVLRFLQKHRKKLARGVLREGSEKLAEADRAALLG